MIPPDKERLYDQLECEAFVALAIAFIIALNSK